MNLHPYLHMSTSTFPRIIFISLSTSQSTLVASKKIAGKANALEDCGSDSIETLWKKMEICEEKSRKCVQLLLNLLKLLLFVLYIIFKFNLLKKDSGSSAVFMSCTRHACNLSLMLLSYTEF